MQLFREVNLTQDERYNTFYTVDSTEQLVLQQTRQQLVHGATPWI